MMRISNFNQSELVSLLVGLQMQALVTKSGKENNDQSCGTDLMPPGVTCVRDTEHLKLWGPTGDIARVCVHYTIRIYISYNTLCTWWYRIYFPSSMSIANT